MELGKLDMKNFFNACQETTMDEGHIITILYNQLCAVNYIHSADIIHRDLKPANFLIDSNCHVKICDFGLSWIMPKSSDIEKKINSFRKKAYKPVIYAQSETERRSREVEFK